MSMTQVKRPQGLLVASMTNHTPKELFCDRYFNWSGTSSPSPPIIPGRGATKFTQFGSKGAVMYSGLNSAHNRTAWVLAWDVPKYLLGGRSKVYVTCGSKNVIDKMTEDQILRKLDEATDESSAIDPSTKTTVKANIRTPNDPADIAIFTTFRVNP